MLKMLILLPFFDVLSMYCCLNCSQMFKSKRPLRIGYFTDIDGVSRVSPSCKRAVFMVKQRLESLGHQVKTADSYILCIENATKR